MEVLPIKCSDSVRSDLKSQNFRGLWGKDVDRSPAADEIDSYNYIEKHYYPFMDESEESIEKVVKEHTKPEYYSYHTTACPEWGGIYSKTDVIVEQKLPVKIAEWTQFIKNKFKLKPNDRMYIEQTIKRFGLKV